MDVHTVVGAGGIGCAIGYALAAGGASVTFVDCNAEKIAHGRALGVAVDRRSFLGASFLHFDDWRPHDGEVVWLCTKCYDNAAVLARLLTGMAVVPVQNGFDPQLDGFGHAAEGIASFVSECLPGKAHTRITRRGMLHLGFRAAGNEPRLGEWADLLRQARLFRVECVPAVRPYKHTKLMYNAAISPIAAACGLDNGQLLGVPAARRLFFALLRENYAILSAAGVPLGKVGLLHPATAAKVLRRPALANALAWAFYPSLRGTYCSMAGDIAKGRTEIDNYNGHLIRLAGDRPCPLNRRVYDVVTRMSQACERPRIEMLDYLTVSPRPERSEGSG